jgi:hypothetical protein
MSSDPFRKLYHLLPLKHTRYPWWKPRYKRMTIAAGFLHRDGVLLCAGTEHESPSMKMYDTKILPFDWHGRPGAFVYAGNGKFAVAAAQRCKTRLEATSSQDAKQVIEDLLDKEYRRVVLSNPKHSEDASLHYWFLVAIPSPSGNVGLYSTHETTIAKVDSFACAGIGELFASHIVKRYYVVDYSEFTTLCVAANMLALVKNHVPGCGGPSQFISLRHDGSVARFDGHPCVEQLETWSEEYAFLAREIVFQQMNPQVSDADFEKMLAAFVANARIIKQGWNARYKKPFKASDPRF